jgi:hypothetical protein
VAVPSRLVAAVGLAAGLLLSASATAAGETRSFVFGVTAKGAPQPVEISCQGPGWTNGSQLCLRPRTGYRWTGAARDAATGLTGKLTGRCTATGRANGSISGGVLVSDPAAAASARFTLTEYGQAVANCTFALAFPRGSLYGAAAVSAALSEGDAPGTSRESITLRIDRGTGIYADQSGRGSGSLVTTVPATTVSCAAVYACRLPIPLVIPRVDSQSEAWHLTLR